MLPTLDDIAPKLAGSKIFSTLDATKSFWLIPLTKDSALLTTFITPFGRYFFKRVPFGISSATQICQRKMAELLRGQEGVEVIVDDIIVHGRNKEEHDLRLKKVLEKVAQSGLKLNQNKCRYGKRELEYFGYIMGESGVKAHPDEVKALLEMKPPQDVSQLRSVLGFMNQVGKFIPHLSSVTKPMTDLLKSDSAWTWGPSQDKAYEEAKRLLGEAPALAYYNSKAPTIVTADASSYGL